MIDEDEITQQADSALSSDDDFSVDPKTDIFTPLPEKRRGRTVYQAAPLLSRFSALIFDLIILYLIYFSTAFIYSYIVFANPTHPIPVTGLQGLIFQAVAIILALLYFILSEFAFSVTIGKLICGIKVRTKIGEPPSLFKIILRNMFKPVDLLLAIPLFTGFLIEILPLKQRLGDLISRTVVVKLQTESTAEIAPSEENLASATGRTFAFIIDFAGIAAGFVGLTLLMSEGSDFKNQIIFVALPLFLFFAFVLPEALWGSTFGKSLFGYNIYREDGVKIGFPEACIRNLMRIIDTNPISYISLLTSRRRQRLGDAASFTVVMKSKRNLITFVMCFACYIISISLLAVGLHNEDSFLRRGYFRNFYPTFFVGSDFNLIKTQKLTKGLILNNFSFISSSGSDVERQPIYEPGEEFFFTFEVVNYSEKNSEIWLKEDIYILYPTGEELKLENFMEIKEKVENLNPIKLENRIQISPSSPSGRYVIMIKIKDNFKGETADIQRYFFVSSADKTPEENDVTTQKQSVFPDENKEKPLVLDKKDFPNMINPNTIDNE